MKPNTVSYQGQCFRIHGHDLGESKFRPIVRSFRSSPRPIQDCIRFMLNEAHIKPNSTRSAIVSAIVFAIKKENGVDLSSFRTKGVEPVTSYVERRIIRVRFKVGRAGKTFIVRLYENDI